MKASLYQKEYRSGLSTRKLFLIAGAVFAATIGASAASTYAWYALTGKFTVAGLKMEVHSDVSFELGRKINGQFVPQGEQPYSLSDFGYDQPTLGNLSNMFYHEDYPSTYSDTFLPTFSKGYMIGGSRQRTEVANNPIEDGYVQFELYLNCSEDAYIYLSTDTKAEASHDANVITALNKGCSVTELDNVVNASRISFYSPLGYAIAELGEEDKHEDVAYAGPLDLGGDGFFDVDGEGKEILYGSYTGDVVYGEPLSQDEPYQGKGDIFHAGLREGNRRIDMDASRLTIEKEGASPLSSYMYRDMLTPSMPVAVAEGGVPTRLVVSVYLEGWDFDMTSSLIDASFGFDLGFVAVFNPEAGQYFNQ